MFTSVADLVKAALLVDGEHHKQWYLEQIAILLGINLNDIDSQAGISP